MHSGLVLSALGGAAFVRAQVTQVQAPAPPPQTLTTTKSGVLPVLPTPFNGIPTNEGALLQQGEPLPGFTGLLGDAVAQNDLPATSYSAILPPENFNPYTGTTVLGNITGVGTAQGIQFTINLSGLPDPATYGPFVYHIHDMPVPEDGNCTSTMGHFDPLNRGEYHPCIASAPQTCQAGDLAGKHGRVGTQSFTATYVEPYLSTDPSSQYFFGAKSIVIHTSNTTRLTCANFQLSSSSSNSTGSSGTTPTPPSNGSAPTGGPSPPPATPSSFTGSAAHVAGGVLLSGVAAVAAALFL